MDKFKNIFESTSVDLFIDSNCSESKLFLFTNLIISLTLFKIDPILDIAFLIKPHIIITNTDLSPAFIMFLKESFNDENISETFPTTSSTLYLLII